MSAIDAGRGRMAETPTEIPRAGWKAALMRVKEKFDEHQVSLVAGGLTFFLLLSLFPGIGALVAIYGLVADPATIQTHLAQLEGVIPSGALGVIQSQLERLAGQQQNSLSIAFAVSLILSLWSANKGVKALFKAMNIAYEEDDERGFLKQNAVTLGFTLATILLVILALGTIVLLPAALSILPIPANLKWIVGLASPLVLALVAMAWLAGLFRFGPDRRPAKFRWLTPGAILVLVGWLVASLAFSLYASQVKDFSATYGSFASIIVFLMWVWIMMMVLVTGGELNAQLEHQTAKDTTVGKPREPGERRATLADQIAALKAHR